MDDDVRDSEGGLPAFGTTRLPSWSTLLTRGMGWVEGRGHISVPSLTTTAFPRPLLASYAFKRVLRFSEIMDSERLRCVSSLI